jgi:hypothetical protein
MREAGLEEVDEGDAISTIDRFTLPLQRLAAAYPDTVDAVFRKILRRRDFTWAEHGEVLMRRRKAWYYEREPRPGVTVIGDRLLELAFGGRR